MLRAAETRGGCACRIKNRALVEGLKNTANGWEKQMVVKLYEAILRADFTLKEVSPPRSRLLRASR